MEFCRSNVQIWGLVRRHFDKMDPSWKKADVNSEQHHGRSRLRSQIHTSKNVYGEKNEVITLNLF